MGVLCAEMTGEDWAWPRLPRTAGIVCRQAPGDTSLYGGRQGGAQAEINRGWSNNPASGQEGGLQGRKVSVTPIPPPMWPFSAQLLLQIFVNNHHVFITYFLSFSAFMASNLASMQLFNFLANSPLSIQCPLVLPESIHTYVSVSDTPGRLAHVCVHCSPES